MNAQTTKTTYIHPLCPASGKLCTTNLCAGVRIVRKG